MQMQDISYTDVIRDTWDPLKSTDCIHLYDSVTPKAFPF